MFRTEKLTVTLHSARVLFTEERASAYRNTDLTSVRRCNTSDARHLPLADSSIFCMMLDPPFLASKGKSLDSTDGNIISRRFGVYPDEKSLHLCYANMLKEAHRVLKTDGILIFKCQDKVSSGKQYLSHVFIVNKDTETGFYPKDLFILLAKNRLTADWQKRHQVHARKYHCYFLVFQKNDRKIQYV